MIFTGIPKASQLMNLSRSSSGTSQHVPTPSSGGVGGTINNMITSSTFVVSAVTGTLPDHHSATPSAARPRCSSILHLFGPWLFEAAFIGSEFAKHFASNEGGGGGGPHSTPAGLRRPNEDRGTPRSPRPGSVHSQSSSLRPLDSLDLPPSLAQDKFESGRAEALGALCRIFCAKKTGEEILPSYLARFYMAVQQGLKVGHDKIVSECLASVLLNSSNLMRIDLEGANLLAPYLVTALETVLPEREIRIASR